MVHRTHAVAILVGLAAGLGCVADLDSTRQNTARGSFGETLYQEGCEHVAWTAQLEEQAQGVRPTVDVTGAQYGSICPSDTPAPDDAPAKLKALATQRSLIVGAVDAILPKDFLDKMEAFLEAIVPLNDDGTMERVISQTADLLATLQADSGLTGALPHFAGRTGYRPHAYADLARNVVSYPGFDDFLEQSTPLFLDADDKLTPELKALLTAASYELRGGQPLAQPADPGRTLQLALDLLLSSGEDIGDGAPLLLTKRDFRGMAQVPRAGDGSLPAPFVDNNGDGLPDVDDHGRFVGASLKPLALATPFPQAGDKATRDKQGRLLGANGQPAYGYLDLDRTLYAGALRESATLLDPQKDTALGMLHGAGALLGPRAPSTKDYTTPAGKLSLSYNGFKTKDSALLDLIHAFVQVLGDPHADQVLQTTQTLLTKYEDPTTRLVAAMFDANDRGKKHPEAVIPPTSDLYDDLIPIINRVLGIPGLAEDLMDALEDPHVKGLPPMFARLLQYADRFQLDQNNQSVHGDFGTAVDHAQPDADWNRSVMQRLLHLINDANGSQFCNKEGASATIPIIGPIGSFAHCKMFEIDDLGLFFALTIADRSIVDDPNRPNTRNMASFREHLTSGTLHTLIQDSTGLLGDQMIQMLTGIDDTRIQALDGRALGTSFTRFPTPEAAARALFLDPAHQSDFMKNATDPVTCVEGDQFLQVHNDTIFGWEKPLANNPSGFDKDTFYDAVRPLINAFARHDECLMADEKGSCLQVRNAARIFLDLMGVLHRHWASKQSSYFGHSFQATDPAQPRYSAGDGVLTYEPLVSEILGQGDLVSALINLEPTLRTMTIDGMDGSPRARPILVQSMQYMFDPKSAPPGLAYRDGRTTTMRSDGMNAGPPVTPYYLLADAYAKKRKSLAAADPTQAGAWRAAASTLVDQALTIDANNGTHQLHNRRMRSMTLLIVDFLRSRLQAHQSGGDADAWVRHDLVANLEESLSGPIFAGLVDLVGKLEQNDAARQQMYGLLNWLLNPSINAAAFRTSAIVLLDQLQLFRDDGDLVPIGRAAGNALDPGKGVLETQLTLLRRAKKLDPNCAKAGDTKSACTLTTVLRNLFADNPTRGATPASDVSDAIGETDRQPADGSGVRAGDWTAADYAATLGNVQGFLLDEQHGFLRFIQIVKSRNYVPDPGSN